MKVRSDRPRWGCCWVVLELVEGLGPGLSQWKGCFLADQWVSHHGKVGDEPLVVATHTHEAKVSDTGQFRPLFHTLVLSGCHSGSLSALGTAPHIVAGGTCRA